VAVMEAREAAARTAQIRIEKAKVSKKNDAANRRRTNPPSPQSPHTHTRTTPHHPHTHTHTHAHTDLAGAGEDVLQRGRRQPLAGETVSKEQKKNRGSGAAANPLRSAPRLPFIALTRRGAPTFFLTHRTARKRWTRIWPPSVAELARPCSMHPCRPRAASRGERHEDGQRELCVCAHACIPAAFAQCCSSDYRTQTAGVGWWRRGAGTARV
jgi:hypothetical protein